MLWQSDIGRTELSLAARHASNMLLMGGTGNFKTLKAPHRVFLHVLGSHTSSKECVTMLVTCVFTALALLVHTLHPTSNVRPLRAWRAAENVTLQGG